MSDIELDGRIREVSSPLSREMLRPLEPQREVVQFKSMLTDSDLERLAAFVER